MAFDLISCSTGRTSVGFRSGLLYKKDMAANKGITNVPVLRMFASDGSMNMSYALGTCG